MDRRVLLGCVIALACGGSGSQVPAAPAHVSATPGNTTVAVEWSAVADATGYAVYYNTANLPLDKDSPRWLVAGTNFTVTALSNGTLYGFAVAARNPNGEGPLSAPAQAMPH